MGTQAPESPPEGLHCTKVLLQLRHSPNLSSLSQGTGDRALPSPWLLLQ